MSVELRPCRQGWVFCDGNCEKCITIATSTTTTNPEKIENCGTKHGRWIRKESKRSYWFECSECGYPPPLDRFKREWFSNYCPNCGARMDLNEVEK